MPNSAWRPGPRAAWAAFERAAQRSVSSSERSAASRVAGYAKHSSSGWMMSAPSACWTSSARSGERKCVEPSTGDRNSTPSSPIRRSFARLQTWNPPESVRSAPSHAMNRWRPPSSRMSSWPGRSRRWKVLPSTICAPAARRSSGARPFTVPRVPTGMNTGVSTAPWPVVRRPARAAPSVAISSKEVTGSASRRRRSRSGTRRAPRGRRISRSARGWRTRRRARAGTSAEGENS